MFVDADAGDCLEVAVRVASRGEGGRCCVQQVAPDTTHHSELGISQPARKGRPFQAFHHCGHTALIYICYDITNIC